MTKRNGAVAPRPIRNPIDYAHDEPLLAVCMLVSFCAAAWFGGALLAWWLR